MHRSNGDRVLNDVVNSLSPTVAIWVYSYKSSYARPVKPSFVIFDIRAF